MLVACAVPLLASTPVSAKVTPGVKPDIVLSADSRAYEKNVDSLLINDFSPLAHDEVEQANPPSPDQCRDLPAVDVLCDVYRIRVVPDPTPGASNFVQILVSWPKLASTPALPLAAVGIGDSDFPDIDLFLYEDAEAPIDYALVGGRSAIIPERIVFEATQLDYDLVIRAGTGVAQSYLLQARVSNELPIKPFELLDEATAPPSGAGSAPADASGAPAPRGGAAPTPPLALAPLDVDTDIAGIDLGATERFEDLALGRHNTRRVAAATDPPSALTLVLAIAVVPSAVAAALVVVMRRRREALAP